MKALFYDKINRLTAEQIDETGNNEVKRVFLKRLELTGFKSFADRLGIDFVPGVTSVVGPNGSGKSNISDAVRWVLGEQSAKNLRGEKMEDVIFSGSERRSPLNMAEISLVLDNEDQHLPVDYSEVAVTRRVYRSGDSEYLLNREPCRLKDINDLFMDSGLGKEAFSIIGQGRVEEILSSKAEERRMIFEEAAGVLKYKFRKQKSEKKLNETEDNLHRVKDILYELENQVEPLKEQAAIAREHIAKTEELKSVETGVLVSEIEERHQEWSETKKELEELSQKNERLETDVNKHEAEIEQLRATMQTLDEQIQTQQQMLLKASEDLEKQESQKQVWQERKKHFSHNKEQFQAEIKELSALGAKKNDEWQQEAATLKAQQQKVAELTERRRLTEEELTGLESNLTEQIESLKSDYIEWLNERAAKSNERSYLEQERTKTAEKRKRLLADHEEWLNHRNQLKAEKDEAERNWQNEKNRLDQLLQEHQQLKEQEQTAAEKIAENDRLIQEASRHREKLSSRAEVLEEMENEYAGFYQGVKEILKRRDAKESGIAGAVAEVIAVPEAYKTAVELALGAAQQHVIVKDETAGREAIHYLKKQNLGRATFLPLNTVKPRFVQEKDQASGSGQPGWVGVAGDLISYDARYEPVIRSLLGNVIVADGLKNAQEIAKLSGQRYRIVTLEGDIINPGGSMTGGSLKQKSSQLIGRKQELERLQEKLTEMTSRMNGLTAEKMKLSAEKEAFDKKIQELTAAGEAAREREQEKKGIYKEAEWALDHANERLEVFDYEDAEAKEEDEKNAAKIEELVKAVTDAEEKVAELNEKIEDLQTREQTSSDQKHELEAKKAELDVALAKEEELLSHREETVSRLEDELTKINTDIERKNAEFSQLEEQLSTGDDSASLIEEEINARRSEKDKAEKAIAEKRAERIDKQQKHEQVEHELKDIKRQWSFVSQTLQEKEVKVNRLDVELDTRLTKLQEEYELSYEAAKQSYALTLPLAEAKKQVKLIRMAIEELGPVNHGAIDEYERVKERFDFLLEQKNDLEEAKTTLHNVIQEMDDEMTRRFNETFEQIQAQFQEVFRELFGGGSASLELSDPNNLLETGVDIIAQPPGKKLQHLALLSGGERALTAIALLFSILKVRPVPFCVLDEVEAALDEANVVRFANYLKEFSKETQFIVVTHRKGTMEHSDILYGVTMQEHGVSNLVSVKLEDTTELIGSDM